MLTNEAGQGRGQCVEHGLAVLAGGQALVLRGEGGQGALPVLGEFTADELLRGWKREGGAVN